MIPHDLRASGINVRHEPDLSDRLLAPQADVRYDQHPGHTDKELSQNMSNILRHAAHAFRIVLQPDGFANLSDVLNACNRTIDEGLNVARTSRKYGQAR